MWTEVTCLFGIEQCDSWVTLALGILRVTGRDSSDDDIDRGRDARKVAKSLLEVGVEWMLSGCSCSLESVHGNYLQRTRQLTCG